MKNIILICCFILGGLAIWIGVMLNKSVNEQSRILNLAIADGIRETDAKWEYKIVTPFDSVFEQEMNIWGNLGWELVTARRAGDEYLVRYECIMKKRVNE